jgi:hypothetical protein
MMRWALLPFRLTALAWNVARLTVAVVWILVSVNDADRGR